MKTRLYNLEKWLLQKVTIDGNTKNLDYLVETIKWSLPYAICKSVKQQEEKKNNPKGTYFKIVLNVPISNKSDSNKKISSTI